MPWPVGLRCLRCLWVLMWSPTPAGPSSSCALPGSPAFHLPLVLDFTPLGVSVQLGQPQSVPGMVGAEPPGTGLAVLSVPCSLSLHISAAFSQAGAG